jgi:hypothetical protein
MDGSRISVYEHPSWGAKLVGEAMASKNAVGDLFIDGVRVETVDVVNMFSVLKRVDGRTQVVLTSFLRLVQNPRHGELPAAKPSPD